MEQKIDAGGRLFSAESPDRASRGGIAGSPQARGPRALFEFASSIFATLPSASSSELGEARDSADLRAKLKQIQVGEQSLGDLFAGACARASTRAGPDELLREPGGFPVVTLDPSGR